MTPGRRSSAPGGRSADARPRAQAGDVVGVHVYGVPPNLVGGEGDGVGLRDEDASAAYIDDCGVAADGGAKQDARIAVLDAGEEAGQDVGWQLAGPQHQGSSLQRSMT